LPPCQDQLWSLFALLSIGYWQLLSLSLQLDTSILAKKCRYQLMQETIMMKHLAGNVNRKDGFSLSR
jgi:hypothetical protein